MKGAALSLADAAAEQLDLEDQKEDLFEDLEDYADVGEALAEQDTEGAVSAAS